MTPDKGRKDPRATRLQQPLYMLELGGKDGYVVLTAKMYKHNGSEAPRGKFLVKNFWRLEKAKTIWRGERGAIPQRDLDALICEVEEWCCDRWADGERQYVNGFMLTRGTGRTRYHREPPVRKELIAGETLYESPIEFFQIELGEKLEE